MTLFQIMRVILLFYPILSLSFNNNLISEETVTEIEILKKQIQEIQIQNKKMIEEIQRKSQQQIDDLKLKIESLETQRLNDKQNIEELKSKNEQDMSSIHEIVDTRFNTYDRYFTKLKFNTDFPSYFRSRSKYINDSTYVGAVKDKDDDIFFADSRLLISPMYQINDYLSLRSQLDIAKNIIWGGIGDVSITDKIIEAPSPSDSFRGALLRDVTDTFSGSELSPYDKDSNYFDIRSLYFVATTPVGELWVGRQPYDWGLGILVNAGSMPDQDLGTIVDRFEFDTAPLALIDDKWENLIVALSIDRLSQGNSITGGADGNGWEIGIGTLYLDEKFELGAYLFLVNQKKFNVSNGLKGDLTNSINWSLYSKYQGNSFYFAMEFQNFIGKVDNLDNDLKQALNSDDIDISLENFLLVTRVGVTEPSSRIEHAVVELGWASGDDSTTYDKLEGNAVFFNNAYTVDNLLFKHILPSVYAIIERHKGKIEVTSEEGRGTTFLIKIPNIQRVANVETTDKSISLKDDYLRKLRKGNILVIDDDMSICNVLSEYLSIYGHNVVVVSDPLKALNNIENCHYDIVFVDYNMPVKNGLDILKEIKSIDNDAVVIIITGIPSENLKNDIIAYGAYSLICKPFSMEQIKTTVSQILGSYNN